MSHVLWEFMKNFCVCVSFTFLINNMWMCKATTKIGKFDCYCGLLLLFSWEWGIWKEKGNFEITEVVAHHVNFSL